MLIKSKSKPRSPLLLTLTSLLTATATAATPPPPPPPAAAAAAARYTITLPATLTPGPITADFHTPSFDQSTLDAPKLPRTNTTTFDWWHFNAISTTNPNVSVAVTFSTGGREGHPLSLPDAAGPLPNGTSSSGNSNGNEAPGALWAHVWVTFEDGRTFRRGVPVRSARVHGSGDAVVSVWEGAGGWMGSEEGMEVEVAIAGNDNDNNGGGGGEISGRMSFERIMGPIVQITNSHIPCSTPANSSTSLSVEPDSASQGHGHGHDHGLGWVSVLPDAIVSVDFTVNGERLQFDGYGSHDKEKQLWSTTPFKTHTKSLTLGRAHVGLYSFLWLSYTPVSGSGSGSGSGSEPTTPAFSSSFLARDGTTLTAGCAPGSVRIASGSEMTEGGLVEGFRVVVPGASVSVATDVEVWDQDRDGHGHEHVRWNGRARGVVTSPGSLGGEGPGPGVGEMEGEEGWAVFERWEY
ncbi:hypothetical protein BJX61DRAFT_547768 [Aspergillus egyptiacus]|nr:hypothetical protein BJX61DRAFT_547768 [Aspergillus egyptiacus]